MIIPWIQTPLSLTHVDCLSFLQTAANTKGVRGRDDQKRRVLTQQEGCLLIIEDTEYYEEVEAPHRGDGAAGARRSLTKQTTAQDHQEWVCELQGVDAQNAQDSLVHINMDETFFEDNEVERGETYMYVPQATIEGHEMTIPDDSTDIVLEKKGNNGSKSSKSSKSDRRERRLSSGISSTDQTTQGKTLNKQRRVLVVRVGSSGDGRTTSASASQLADDVFTDSVSLATQYKRCSYGKLEIVPATGSNVVNGVVTVSLNGKDINGEESATVRSWMTDAAQSRIGVSSLSASYDHVMFCQPPGTVKGGNGW